MSEKCQTLVNSRRAIIAVIDEKPVMDWKQLKEPEPCGENGGLYEIRSKERQVNVKKPKEIPPMAEILGEIPPITVKAGTQTIKQVLCDRHKAKAEREGKLLTKVTN